MAGLSLSLIRPNSVAIFRKTPADVGKVLAFILSDVAIPSGKRVRFDLSKSRDHGKAYDVTSNPVERATSDNIIKQPDTLDLVGRLSANPLGFAGAAALLGTLGAFVRRDLIEVEKLRKIADEREPVIVVTPERTYPSMAITSMRERYDDSTGNGVLLTLSLREIKIVSPFTVAGVVDTDQLLATAFESQNMGSQAPVAVPDPGGLG